MVEVRGSYPKFLREGASNAKVGGWARSDPLNKSVASLSDPLRRVAAPCSMVSCSVSEE